MVNAFTKEVSVLVKNSTFSEPAFVGKIGDGIGLTDWPWMGKVSDCGMVYWCYD